jgi:hypothetical protein
MTRSRRRGARGLVQRPVTDVRDHRSERPLGGEDPGRAGLVRDNTARAGAASAIELTPEGSQLLGRAMGAVSDADTPLRPRCRPHPPAGRGRGAGRVRALTTAPSASLKVRVAGGSVEGLLLSVHVLAGIVLVGGSAGRDEPLSALCARTGCGTATGAADPSTATRRARRAGRWRAAAQPEHDHRDLQPAVGGGRGADDRAPRFPHLSRTRHTNDTLTPAYRASAPLARQVAPVPHRARRA